MSQDAAVEEAATPAPVAPKQRIATLDLIRGLAILGILAVNADGFAGPMSAYGSAALWPFPNEGATALSKWVVDAFFHEKFIALFSMLFGVSIFLVGGERSDPARGRLIRRRLFWLVVFALIHGLAIWWGDVLLLYAWAGMFVMLARSWRPRWLFGTGLALFLALALMQILAPLILQFAPPEAQAQALARMHPTPEKIAAVQADFAQAAASWAGAYAQNFKGWLVVQGASLTFYALPTVGLMMIGLGLFKTGFFPGRRGVPIYLAAAAAGGAALWVVAGLTWRHDVLEDAPLWGPGVEALLAPVIGLGYASVLILIWKAGLARMLAPLAAAGGMAFTNYLTQSLIMTTIFYGGRLGLMGQVDRPDLWKIVGAVWLLQLVWSTLWLSHFQMGPLEWVWRCLTYGRFVPISKPKSA